MLPEKLRKDLTLAPWPLILHYTTFIQATSSPTCTCIPEHTSIKVPHICTLILKTEQEQHKNRL